MNQGWWDEISDQPVKPGRSEVNEMCSSLFQQSQELSIKEWSVLEKGIELCYSGELQNFFSAIVWRTLCFQMHYSYSTWHICVILDLKMQTQL